MLTKSPTINQVPRSMVRWIQDVLCMSDIVCRQGKGRGGGVEEKKLKSWAIYILRRIFNGSLQPQSPQWTCLPLVYLCLMVSFVDNYNPSIQDLCLLAKEMYRLTEDEGFATKCIVVTQETITVVQIEMDEEWTVKASHSHIRYILTEEGLVGDESAQLKGI